MSSDKSNFRHLSEVSHRETFESAHSVILAVFASHAQQQQRQSVVVSDRVDLLSAYSEDNDFIKKMVPFYARCLIEVSITVINFRAVQLRNKEPRTRFFVGFVLATCQPLYPRSYIDHFSLELCRGEANYNSVANGLFRPCQMRKRKRAER